MEFKQFQTLSALLHFMYSDTKEQDSVVASVMTALCTPSFGDLSLVESWILHKRSILFLKPILPLKIQSLFMHLLKKNLLNVIFITDFHIRIPQTL